MLFTEDLLPQQPEEPLPGDCCGNGCNPCVLDVYQDMLEKWKVKSRNIKEGHETASPHSVPVLSMTRYMPFQVVSICKLTNDSNIYRFQAVVVTGPSGDKSLATNDSRKFKVVEGNIMCSPGQHLMLRNSYKETVCGEPGKLSDEAVVTRAYTPISDAADHVKGKFHVMIKIYEKGKMSSFVRQMQVGDITFWRGPYGSFKYQRNGFPSILMLCAGTGVAPMYSIAKMIVNDEQDDTILRMKFACRSLQDFLLRNEIHTLSSFWNFRADIFLSSDDSGTPRYGEHLHFGRIGKDQVECEVRKLGSNKCLVLICGPPSFTQAMAEIVEACSVLTENVYIF